MIDRVRAHVIAYLLVAACGGHGRAQPPSQGPQVDLACVDKARRGVLLDSFPPEIAGFRVVRTEIGVQLLRDGRPLDDGVATLVFDDSIDQKMGLYRMDSGIDKCDGLPAASCFGISMYVCEVSLETLAGWVNDVAQKRGAGDGALGINVIVRDAWGPRCKGGPACKPQAYYSSKGRYDPAAPRRPTDAAHGFGQCEHDGECEAEEGVCSAWYLAGGAQTLEYVEASVPTFCGCIDRKCSWFTQGR